MVIKNSCEQVKSLWIQMRHQGNNRNLVASVYCRLPDQGEPSDQSLLLQLQESSHLWALVLLGDFNHPDCLWESNMVSYR